MKKYEISEQLVSQIFEYLIQRPFREVEPFVNGLREVVKQEIIEKPVEQQKEKLK